MVKNASIVIVEKEKKNGDKFKVLQIKVNGFMVKEIYLDEQTETFINLASKQ